MPTIHTAPGTPIQHHYRMLGGVWGVDQPLLELDSFRVNVVGAQHAAPLQFDAAPLQRQHNISRLTFQGWGWLGGRDRWLQCWQLEDGYWLSVPELGCCSVVGESIHVWENGDIITPTPALPQIGDLGEGETSHFFLPHFEKNGGGVRRTEGVAIPSLFGGILSPAIGLVARRIGIGLLHASCVTWRGRAMLFLGESGQGKSTLARFLGAQLGYQQIMDDATPIRTDSLIPLVLPDFPQPKMSPRAPLLESIPLGAIYILDPRAAVDSPITATPLSPLHAVRAVIRHTICAKLFARPDLVAQQESYARLVTQVPIQTLTYPKTWETLPALAQYLSESW